MISKHQRNHSKAARKAFIAQFKKKRSEASLFLIINQCKIDDNKFSTTNTSNRKDNSRTWLWNKSANESNLDFEEEDNYEDNGDDRNDGDNRDDKNLEKEYSKIEEETSSSEVLKKELKWNKKEEHSFCRSYKSRSRLTKKKKGNQLKNQRNKI